MTLLVTFGGTSHLSALDKPPIKRDGVVNNDVTTFVLDYFSESLGAYLQGFVKMSLWADAFGEAPGWLASWTVFYWAWWISWTPFVGSFVAHISRGRTIREFIACILLAPAVISFLFITVMGGNAIALDLGGNPAVALAMQGDISYAPFALYENLQVLAGTPIVQILAGVTIVLAFPFIFVIGALMVSFVRVARREVDDIDKLKNGGKHNEELAETPNKELIEAPSKELAEAPSKELTEALSEQTP